MKISLDSHIIHACNCLPKGVHSKVVLEPKKQAKGVKYELMNDGGNELSYYDVDDCLFPKKGRPQQFNLCDYLVLLHDERVENTKYIWVETKKTSDIDHAAKQILNAFSSIEIENSRRENHYARIILGKVSNKSTISGDNFKTLKKEFQKRFDFSSQVYNKDKSSQLYLRTN